MKKTMTKACICLITLSILLLPVLSCRKSKPVAEAQPKEDISPIQINEVIKEINNVASATTPKYDEGIITFFSGDVSIRENESWYEAAIGDIVNKSNIVKVASDSYCEIQFGDRAVIKIQENSEVDLAVVNSKPGEANLDLDMRVGTVLSKVQKLASEEKFRVRTQTAVCGVRGTEFSVSSENGKDTTLAVREGAVAVLPRSVDVDNLKEKAAGKSNAVAAIDKIEQNAPVVKANEQILINEKVLANTKKSADNVTAAVNTISKEQGTAASQASIKKLETAISEHQKIINTNVGSPKTIAAVNTNNLAKIDDMRMLDIVPDMQGNMPKLLKVSVESMIEETSIEVNGKFVGLNNFAGLYNEGEKLHFNISKEGYKPYSFEFEVKDITAKSYKVELIADPESKPAPAATTSAPVTKQVSVKTMPADADIVFGNKTVGKGSYNSSYNIGANVVLTAQKSGYVTKTVNLKIDENTPSVVEISLDKIADKTIAITTVPNDSQIYVNNKAVEKGKYTASFKPGEKFILSASRDGYETKTLTIDVTADTPSTLSLTLAKKPVDLALSPFTGKVVDKVVYSNGRIFAADASGTLYSSALDGKNSWKKTTENSPNGNSSPVAAGNNIIFTGTKEMLVLDAATGNINNQVSLDTNSTHMFGREVVSFNNSFIYPKNNSLLISTLAKNASEEIINLPVESGMTPAIWQNKIVIADIEGTVNIINPAAKTIEASIKTSAVQPIALSITISGNTGYFADRNGTVVAVDLNSKKVLWESKINDPKPNVFTNLSYGSGNIFAYTGSKIFTFNMQTGKEAFASIESTCAPAYNSGKIYYGNSSGSLIEANAETGKTIRITRINNGNITTLPLFAANKIIAGTSTGKILILNPAGL